ncbi:MAG: hypothetical protein GDA46_06440 [Bdellovibrionales bacterium]|nr:hypothetical protein [Bdellovibrionales bacterium]
MNYILKISAAGNRFILIDKRWFNKVPENSSDYFYPCPFSFESFLSSFRQNLILRKKQISYFISQPQLTLTDGCIILREERESLICDFYNKDGSQAEMCGNAACCISFYLEDLNLNVKNFRLGEKKILTVPKGGIILDKPKNPILTFHKPFFFSFIDTGVPHGVIYFPHLDFKESRKLKKKVEKLRFQNINSYNKGMNVSFYEVLSPNHLKAITYERGVEDFTLSCGTGALAVSLVYKEIANKTEGEIKVQMPGGTLKIVTGQKLKLFSQVKKGF